MELLELKKNTFYKILKEYEDNKLRPTIYTGRIFLILGNTAFFM